MKQIAVFLLLAVLFAPSAAAVDVAGEQTRQFGLDRVEVPGEGGELMPDISPTEPADLSGSLGEVLSKGLSRAGTALFPAMRTAASMLAVVVLCSMAGQLEPERTRSAAALAGTLAITLLGVGSFRSMVAVGQETLESLRSFSMLLLPALSAATVASGAPLSASAVYAAAIFVSDVLMTVINRLLIPLLYALLALGAADAALGNQALAGLRGVVRGVLTGGLKLTVLAFTGYISLSGIVAGASDGAMLRAAKAAIGAMVPVVGGMISDASDTVLSSARVLRSAAGTFGMVAVLAICLLPLLRLGVQRFILKLTGALSEIVGEKSLAGAVDSVAEVMGFLMAMTAASGFMLLISFVAFIKAVGA